MHHDGFALTDDSTKQAEISAEQVARWLNAEQATGFNITEPHGA